MPSLLETIGFITGAICVWLTVRQSAWNFPFGMINVAAFSVVFAQSKLYADAGLQGVYFVLSVIGWYLWMYGGEDHSKLKAARASTFELSAVIATAAVLTVTLWKTLHHVGGSASFWDALTTSISLGSQWLLNRKKLENWIGWILVDIIYIPLYVSKELYLTAILYAIFLVMATTGLIQWRKSWLADRALVELQPLAERGLP
jgi:nicotinamide mononucleotide transporter